MSRQRWFKSSLTSSDRQNELTLGNVFSNRILSQTDFIAYDERFFDLIGPSAKVEKVQELPLQIHEASCFNLNTKELFFAEWGPPGGIVGNGLNGTHTWQYLLNTETNVLRNITTSPPTFNAHGCVFYNNSFHVVSDGGPNNTATLSKIDPTTLESTVLLNNYYQQPFISFNDFDIDQDGNFWIADSLSGWVCVLHSSRLALDPWTNSWVCSLAVSCRRHSSHKPVQAYTSLTGRPCARG